MLLAPEEAVEVAPGEEGDDDEADDGDDPFGHKKRKKKKETETQMAVSLREERRVQGVADAGEAG